MDTAKLTVFFQDPFWVGLYEREEGGQYSVCRITFGAEPKDHEVYAFLMQNWSRLKFSPSIGAEASAVRIAGHKRMQRLAKKELHAAPGTKAQQALKLQQEQGALSRKARSRRHREERERQKRELRSKKRKEKHRGH